MAVLSCRMIRAARVFFGTMALILGLLIMGAIDSPARAHAALLEADPPDGAVLQTAPAILKLQFSEPVQPMVLDLTGAEGTEDLRDHATIDGATLAIHLPGNLGDGTYGLGWRVVSADGHPVSGTQLFVIGEPGAAAIPTIATESRLHSAIWAMRIVHVAGLFIGVGGVFFSRWIGGRTGRGDGIMAGSIIAGMVAVFMSLGLQGLDLLGLSWAAIVTPPPWAAALASSLAVTGALAVIAFACAFLALRGVAAKPLSAIGFAAIGLGLMASGHVGTAEPHWLTRPAIFIHVSMAAFWIGALIPLVGVFAAPHPEAGAGAVLLRFSRLIPWSLALLIAAGIVMARVQVGDPQALTGTAYGRVLLVKLALLVPLFALAAINRFRLTAPVMRAEPRAVARFRAALLIELGLMLAILATTALWRFTPPPRALAAAVEAADTGPAMVHIEAAGNMVMVHVEPDRPGPVAAEVYVYDMAGDALPAQEITLTLANPAAGIAPIHRRITAPDAFDAWHAEDLILHAPGDWFIQVEAVLPGAEPLVAEGILSIAR